VDRNRFGLLVLNVIFLLALGGIVWNAARHAMSETITWTEAKEQIKAGEVERVVFEGNEFVQLFYKEPGGTAAKVQQIPRVAADETFVPLLEENKVPYSAAMPSNCDQLGVWILPMMLLLGLWVMLSRRDPAGAPPGVATFGKSQARLVPEEGTGVTFDDVAGIDEAETELQEIVQFLKTPERFTQLGGRIPKGVLLVGPPGTGKTLLARAVAGEAGVPFFSISGSNFVEMFVGVGAARVRDLFEQATKHAPCIIFIDELDAIGKTRAGAGPLTGNDEREQTLNQLLVEMDGFDGKKGIVIMAATNRPETLDPALLRAGRFDRRVAVDLPDLRGRREILKVHAREVKLGPDVDLDEVARRTPGFSGADLQNALNEAALLAARRSKTQVEMIDVDDAVERLVAGLERKSRRISDKEREIVAHHEAGHAICAAASPGADPVQKISIIPRGVAALGFTLQTPAEDRNLASRSELEGRLVTLYGGRAAEELVLGNVTTGAYDDIRKASDLARRMVTQYGMSDAMGAIDYGHTRKSPFGFAQEGDVAVSEGTAQQVDDEVRRMLDLAHDRALEILELNGDVLHNLAMALLEHEVLDQKGLVAFLKDVRTAPADRALEA
jgi:cell division protease FtsH